MTHDVGSRIKKIPGQEYINADDMAIASEEIEDLQVVMNELSAWAEENEIEINEEKIEFVVFRKGGRLA